MAARLVLVAVLVALAGPTAAEEEPKRLTLDLEDVTLETVAKIVVRRTQVRVDVAPAARAERVTIHAAKRTAEEVLREAAKRAGVPCVVLSNGTFLLGRRSAPSSESVRHALATSRVSFQHRETPLAEIVDDLSRQVGVPFLLDPFCPPRVLKHRVSLQVKKLPTTSALQILCAWFRMEHDARWGTVVVTSQGELAKLPERLLPITGTSETEKNAVARTQIAATPVGFRVENETLPDLLARVSEQISVKIEVRPASREVLRPVKVTWQVRDVPAEAVLVLLLSRRGLRCRLEGGVLVVESATETAEPKKR